jgi:hypothetical protein
MKQMNKKPKYFSQSLTEAFSPSTHWEHCLLLENEMSDFLKYVPIYDETLKDNWKVSSPKLVDIFVRSCFLLEAAMKSISNEPTNRIVEFLKRSNHSWCAFLLKGRDRHGKECDLDILDLLTFYQEYCSLDVLEVRIRYTKLSDLWINRMDCMRPFSGMKIENNMVTRSPEWWGIYTNLKHSFYSGLNKINLETTFGSLAALISFSAIVPQMRQLLCDHGYIQDDFQRPVNVESFGKRVNDKFAKDPWAKHTELVLEGFENSAVLPPMACISNLFIVQIYGDYKEYRLWSGWGRG